MSQGTLGSYNGEAVAGVDMMDMLRKHELIHHPTSTLRFSKMSIKKLGIQCEPGVAVAINGTVIPIISGTFELGYGQIEVNSLIFKQTCNISMYYMY